MGGLGIVQTEKIELVPADNPFQLESGATLGPITVAFETYGRLNAAGDNAILILHALTGDAHAAGKHRPDDKIPGWWDPAIGPGRAFDTDRYFVICSNVLGSCNGTTGPASVNPETGKPYGMTFPVVTIGDMVRLQKILLDHLGVKHLVAVAGGSMGGMQVLEWMVSYPDMMDAAIAIATAGRLYPQGIAYNEVQRQAITLDPDWQNGDYYGGTGPTRGLSLARQIATITYKSDQSFQMKFARNFAGREKDYYRFHGQFEVESYLHYIGQKLPKRFDANSYLYLTKAMDLFDLGRGRGSFEEALGRTQAKTLLIGISSDILYPPYQQQELAEILLEHGKWARYQELESPYGHDAFLIEFEKMSKILKQFLKNL